MCQHIKERCRASPPLLLLSMARNGCLSGDKINSFFRLRNSSDEFADGKTVSREKRRNQGSLPGLCCSSHVIPFFLIPLPPLKGGKGEGRGSMAALPRGAGWWSLPCRARRCTSGCGRAVPSGLGRSSHVIPTLACALAWDLWLRPQVAKSWKKMETIRRSSPFLNKGLYRRDALTTSKSPIQRS